MFHGERNHHWHNRRRRRRALLDATDLGRKIKMSRRSIESGKRLADELAAVVCAETGQTPAEVAAIVRPIARYLDREYGGQMVYKKAQKREVLIANIQRDLKNRVPKTVICRIHGISTRTLYRLIVDNDAEAA
jgi:sirohydrochlorin ferrochelatase